MFSDGLSSLEGRDGAVVRALASHHCGLGSNPGFNAIIIRVDFVVGSLLCSKRFSPGNPVSPSPQKATFPKFQFNHLFIM